MGRLRSIWVLWHGSREVACKGGSQHARGEETTGRRQRILTQPSVGLGREVVTKEEKPPVPQRQVRAMGKRENHDNLSSRENLVTTV